MVIFKKIIDVRLVALAVIIIAIFLGGLLFANLPDSWVIGDSKDYSEDASSPTYLLNDKRIESAPAIAAKSPTVDAIAAKSPAVEPILAKLDPQGHSKQQQQLLAQQQFTDAAKLLQIGHYQQAVTAFHKVLIKSPDLPEAHINLGFAMLGLGELKKAVKSFTYALTFKPQAADAYYGLALVAEKELDYEVAMGAMRTYLHLRKDDAYIAKARAALRYWEAELKNKAKQQANDLSSAKASTNNQPTSH